MWGLTCGDWLRGHSGRHGPAWRGLTWQIEVRGLAKCIVGANESRTLPLALPKHRTLFGIMRSPSTKTTAGAGATVPSADICSMSTADISISIRCCITQHQRLALARSRWTQDGDNMVPRWPEMLQHGSKKNSTWPKGASRSGQVGQLGAQVGPTWP